MARPRSRTATIQELAQRLRRLEQSHKRAGEKEPLSTGIEPLDRLLPAGGIHPGGILEWLADGEGSGTGTLSLISAARAMQAGGALIVVDESREFYPPAAAGLGVDLENTIVVRPGNRKDALWALEQSLRCPGVASTWCRLERLTDRQSRRLQLAAEAGGGLGLLLRPASVRSQPSWAEARLLVEPLPAAPLSEEPRRHGDTEKKREDRGLRMEDGRSAGAILDPRSSILDLQNSVSPCLRGEEIEPARRRVRVEVLQCRGGIGGGTVELEICDETAHVHLAPRLAPAANPRRATGTS